MTDLEYALELLRGAAPSNVMSGYQQADWILRTRAMLRQYNREPVIGTDEDLSLFERDIKSDPTLGIEYPRPHGWWYD